MSWKKILLEGDAAVLSDTGDAAVLSDTVPVDVTISAASAGSATEASRQDHKHDINVKVNELNAPDGALDMNSQRILGLGAVTTQGDALPADANLRAADSTLLEGDSKTTVQNHAPQAHEASHKSGGGDEILLHEFGVPTSAVNFNKQQATSLALDVQSSAPGTPVNGQVYYNDTDDHPYVYVSA